MSRPLATRQLFPLTGPDSPINRTDIDWGANGMDLGSSFLHKGNVCVLFGDSFGPEKSDWRSNLLAIGHCQEPEDGFVIDRMIADRPGHAKELLPSRKIDFDEMTVIPTYGISTGNRMFIHYMSVHHWGEPGKWDLNHSGWAYSDDDGDHWVMDHQATWPANSNFGQVALEHVDGEIWIWGIPSGRWGGVQLAKSKPESLLQLDQYQYWTGADWSDDATRAAIVVPPRVGELSVRYNSFYDRWILMYFDHEAGEILLRMASNPIGPWDAPRVVLREVDYPWCYAPFQYPVWNDREQIYFNMSMFEQYQVFLMETTPAR